MAYLAQSKRTTWQFYLQRLAFTGSGGRQKLEMAALARAPSAFEQPLERRLPTRQDASRARAA